MKRFPFALGALLLAFPLLAGDTPSEVRERGLTPDVIGEEIVLDAPDSLRFDARRASTLLLEPADEPQLVWSTELTFDDAEYIAPHFSKFQLPDGAYAIVRSPDGSRSWTYRGAGKEAAGDGFWGIHIYGDRAIVEVFSTEPVPAGAVVIDRFARGFRDWEMPEPVERILDHTICGSDDSQWAKCYQTSQPTAYSKSRAVARLLINGTSACTGWLVGSEGHIMTNQHCIGTSSDAANTNFEFMAEGACTTSCASWGACPGTVVASSSTLIKVNSSLDYALVKLPTNPTATYGYLQMRSSGAVLNERIYIPQHPAHWGKKIAMTSAGANAKIDSLSAPACSGGTSDLGYAADTQGGSSGSPVIAYGDNLVIGLHHCGACPNRAVPIQSVISNLGTSVPANAVAGSGGGGGTTSQILLNPGFESGATSWTATTGVITNSTSRTPRAGSWYAWLNGTGATGTETLYQQITIPSDATAASLSFYLKIDTAETTTSTAYDRLQVQIRNSSNTVLATLATYSNLNKGTSYVQRTFNILSYKGQTIRVYFLGTEDSSLQTSFVIDDTAVSVTR